MKKSLLLCSLVFSAGISQAQDPGGHAFHIDYADFQIDNLIHYINCGNDASFNLGANMTMEVWAKPYSSAWNQKVMGKVTPSFNSGYMLALDQGKIYPEIWTPGQTDMLNGFIPPAPQPYYWVHLAVTYDGSKLRGYINGVMVGEEVASGALATNTNPFIIGVAPWDLSNFQFFGDLDEIRVWNTARTEQQVRDNMHIALTGSEAGLVAYYNCNQTTGLTLPDLTSNGNDGTLTSNCTDVNWQPARTVIGNGSMNSQADIYGLWNALAFSDPRFVTTTNGLSLLASGIPANDYIVYGHNSGTGVSTTNNPTNAPAGFEYTGRIWYVNNIGGFPADYIFDLDDAAAGGATLDLTQPAGNYALLRRNGTTGAFTAVALGTSKSNNVITFAAHTTSDGYYTIGVSDTPIQTSASIDEATTVDFGLFPNPAEDQITVVLPTQMNGELMVYNAVGQLVSTQNLTSELNQVMKINEFTPGIYTVVLTTDNTTVSRKKLIVQ